jgi:hypothetical protein
VNDGVLVEVIHGGHETILELLLGGDADVAQHGAGEFGKEALDEIEPRAVLGSVAPQGWSSQRQNRHCSRFPQDYAREKEKLEEEIAAQREVWEKDTAQLERQRKEQEEALKKQRQREIDDYEYKKILDRKKTQDKYEGELRVRDMKNQEQQEALEKGWQRREAIEGAINLSQCGNWRSQTAAWV